MIIAACVVGGTGLVIGLLLGVAGKIFEVQTDEKEVAIREVLPGNNCGGCGYAGCDALAKAIANGEAAPSACPVGGAAVAEKIGEIIGAKVSVSRNVALVQCAGTCDKSKNRFEYYGNMSCKQAVASTGGGQKICQYGCLGYGSCVAVCEFGALSIVDGVARVDREACVACGKCVAACPKNLITLVPYDNQYFVTCSSKDLGKDTRQACQAGCLGCKMCEKACEHDAIHVNGNNATIDYEKCTNCGECAKKCPVKIIRLSNDL